MQGLTQNTMSQVRLAGVATMCVVSVLAVSAQASETNIKNRQDQVNKYFEHASKDFGGGAVQLHARKDGADGSTHSIYHFDCVNKKYDVLFSGPAMPGEFPFDSADPAATSFDQNADVAPLAQHTCTKHGYPLLEW